MIFQLHIKVTSAICRTQALTKDKGQRPVRNSRPHTKIASTDFTIFLFTYQTKSVYKFQLRCMTLLIRLFLRFLLFFSLLDNMMSESLTSVYKSASKIRALLNGAESEIMDITIGVPQRSCLGALVFFSILMTYHQLLKTPRLQCMLMKLAFPIVWVTFTN